MERRAFLESVAIGAAALLSGRSTASAKPTNHVVAEAAAKLIEERYVDSHVARQVAFLVRTSLRAGRYRQLSRSALADKLTNDIRSVNGDLHLRVTSDAPLREAESAKRMAEDELHPRTTNFGVQTVARLQGNVGLMRVTHFPSPPYFFDNHYASALELLRYTSALILDLRINHGGGADTVGYFLSYFINGEVEFGRMISRSEPPEITKTTPYISGKAYGEGRPIYVVMSRNTFSAGEAVADYLRRFRRSNPAILVGEPTKGGAHAGSNFSLPDDFTIFIPSSRNSGPDWEGVGVVPDVTVPAAEALRVAHRLAVEKLLKATSDANVRQILENVRAGSIENLSSFSF